MKKRISDLPFRYRCNREPFDRRHGLRRSRTGPEPQTSIIFKWSQTLSKQSESKGFTIIEILIVIVIIGILAAITFISYTGFQGRAIAVSLQSDLTNASDQLVIDQAKSSTDVFPATLAAASGIIKWSGNTVPTYKVNNTNTPRTFCLTATKSNQSYFITQEGLPIPGPCPVLYLDADIPTSYPETGTNWYDLSGNGNNSIMCTLVFGSCVAHNSMVNGSLVLDGVLDYASVADPTSGSLDFGTGNFTVGSWIYISGGYLDYRDLIFKGALSGHDDPGWRFGLSTSGIPHMLIEDTSYLESDLGTTAVGLNAWHYVVITYNRTSNAIGYIDGSKVGTANISTKTGSVDNNSEVMIGYGDHDPMTWFNGKIGIVTIYNTALSDSDIKKLFDANRGRYGV
jgi:general secretion pathway protein G